MNWPPQSPVQITCTEKEIKDSLSLRKNSSTEGSTEVLKEA